MPARKEQRTRCGDAIRPAWPRCGTSAFTALAATYLIAMRARPASGGRHGGVRRRTGDPSGRPWHPRRVGRDPSDVGPRAVCAAHQRRLRNPAGLRARSLRVPGPSGSEAIVDVPLAIPTLVTGVMLLALYGPARLRRLPRGFRHPGRVHATRDPACALFVTLPFVVRTVQPVLSELDMAEEEAAQP